jgi:hypothetical protein
VAWYDGGGERVFMFDTVTTVSISILPGFRGFGLGDPHTFICYYLAFSEIHMEVMDVWLGYGLEKCILIQRHRI